MRAYRSPTALLASIAYTTVLAYCTPTALLASRAPTTMLAYFLPAALLASRPPTTVRTSAAHLALRARLHPVLAWPLCVRGSLPLRALRLQLFSPLLVDIGTVDVRNWNPDLRAPNRRHPPTRPVEWNARQRRNWAPACQIAVQNILFEIERFSPTPTTRAHRDPSIPQRIS